MNDPSRPLYKSTSLIAGTLFLVLGAGNWFIGDRWGDPYRRAVADHPEPIARPAYPKASFLQDPDEGHERMRVARAKLEFYQFVQTGGRVILGIGLFLLVGALLSFARDRRRRAVEARG